MRNDITTIRPVKNNRRGFITFVAFGIAMTLLTGCGQTGTSKMGDSSNLDAAAIAPQGSTEEMNANMDENNPFAAAGINNPTAFVKMFETAKAAIAASDKKAVAELILFPLQVNGEQPVKIASKVDFIESYDQIITESVKDALAAQTVKDLFVRDQGVMVETVSCGSGLQPRSLRRMASLQ